MLYLTAADRYRFYRTGGTLTRTLPYSVPYLQLLLSACHTTRYRCCRKCMSLRPIVHHHAYQACIVGC